MLSVRADVKCASCGRALRGAGATQFLCPNCGETAIGRCSRCRDQSVTYRCPKCAFEGP